MANGLIDWDLLDALSTSPAMSQPAMWDAFAARYNGYAALQEDYTRLQVDAMKIGPGDSVADVGAGPGRITLQAAQGAGAVTAIDVSREMLGHLEANVVARGLRNVSTIHLSWDEVVPGENVPLHDIVVASRSPAMRDLKKLDALARKYVFVMTFCGPSLKNFHDALVAGIEPKPPRGGGYRPAMAGHALVFNRLIDMGIEANVGYLPDGFSASWRDWDALLAHFAWLGIPPDRVDRFRKNIEPYLTQDGSGLHLRMETRTVVVWWKKDARLPDAGPSAR
jgi:SAM-dependent methyltransferase